MFLGSLRRPIKRKHWWEIFGEKYVGIWGIDVGCVEEKCDFEQIERVNEGGGASMTH